MNATVDNNTVVLSEAYLYITQTVHQDVGNYQLIHTVHTVHTVHTYIHTYIHTINHINQLISESKGESNLIKNDIDLMIMIMFRVPIMLNLKSNIHIQGVIMIDVNMNIICTSIYSWR